ncbi:MAG: DUF4363 family protein [Clostridiales bacterium]|nr:DUF4363 family protein [Clostridiales bacterium]
MKTWAFMIAIILIVGGLEFASTSMLKRVSEETLSSVEELAAAVDEERWEEADALAADIRDAWDRLFPKLHFFFEHSQAESVDIAMQRVLAMLPGRNREELHPEITALSREIWQLARRYALTPGNIL